MQGSISSQLISSSWSSHPLLLSPNLTKKRTGPILSYHTISHHCITHDIDITELYCQVVNPLSSLPKYLPNIPSRPHLDACTYPDTYIYIHTYRHACSKHANAMRKQEMPTNPSSHTMQCDAMPAPKNSNCGLGQRKSPRQRGNKVKDQKKICQLSRFICTRSVLGVFVSKSNHPNRSDLRKEVFYAVFWKGGPTFPFLPLSFLLLHQPTQLSRYLETIQISPTYVPFFVLVLVPIPKPSQANYRTHYPFSNI